VLGHSQYFGATSGTDHPMTMCHTPKDLNPLKTVLFGQSSTVNSYLYDMSA
jgi:hypothetical protein